METNPIFWAEVAELAIQVIEIDPEDETSVAQGLEELTEAIKQQIEPAQQQE